MAFADNRGVRIHYQVVGEGPPLVLQHGFSDSLMTWHERGYVDALKGTYRLILVDARGHHLSDKPHAPEAYVAENFVADITCVLDALGIARASYMGYSMGGWIGYAMAQFAPARVDRLVIGAASPFPAEPGAPDPMLPILQQGASGLLSFYTGFMTPALEARLLASDMAAIIACRQTRYATHGFVAALAEMRMPTLLYAGDADPVHEATKQAAARIPGARFVSIPGLHHVPTMMARAAVLAHVTPFFAGAGG